VTSLPAIDPNAIPTESFSWGTIKWFVTPDMTEGAALTFGEVVMQPGEGHGRHNHPDAEELLYVLSGTGEQTIDGEPPFQVGPGDVIYIPKAVYHSTANTGWSPMHVLALYNPGGSEAGLRDLPDHKELAPGVPPVFVRSDGTT
jgi:oxalate decarboxylase/phosphoglucose isomerase-like protein (cupin superfamily)